MGLPSADDACQAGCVERFSPGRRPQGPLGITVTRGFPPVYNNEYLIRALALLPEAVQDYRVTFASKGPTFAATRALADTLLPTSVRRRVEFLGGVSNDTLRDALKSSDLYVSLSTRDGTSTSLLEALACGVFSLLSDIPANREWIDGSTGLLVPLGRPEVLAAAPQRALQDAALRRRAAKLNRKLV